MLQVSEQGLRKILYQKVSSASFDFPPQTYRRFRQIVAAFPEGWMSSGQISRDGAFAFLPALCSGSGV